MLRRGCRVLVGLGPPMWLLLVLLAGPALGQPYVSPTPATLEVGLSTVAQGESTSVAGRGCRADAQVEVTFDTIILATAKADASGIFSAEITIPPDAAPGPRTLLATCAAPDNSPVNLTAQITVVEVEVTPEPTPDLLGVTAGPEAPTERRGLPASFVVVGTAIVAALGAGTIWAYRKLES